MESVEFLKCISIEDNFEKSKSVTITGIGIIYNDGWHASAKRFE